MKENYIQHYVMKRIYYHLWGCWNQQNVPYIMKKCMVNNQHELMHYVQACISNITRNEDNL